VAGWLRSRSGVLARHSATEDNTIHNVESHAIVRQAMVLAEGVARLSHNRTSGNLKRDSCGNWITVVRRRFENQPQLSCRQTAIDNSY
jgi:hypothetical protein